MKIYSKREEQAQIHQFLMGLSSQKFGTMRSNLLTRINDLNLDSVYSQTIQEERHLNATEIEKIPTVGFSATVAPESRQFVVCSHCG